MSNAAASRLPSRDRMAVTLSHHLAALPESMREQLLGLAANQREAVANAVRDDLETQTDILLTRYSNLILEAVAELEALEVVSRACRGAIDCEP